MPEKHNPIKPSMLRRMHNHDYSSPGYYFVTIRLSPYIPRLSNITGSPDSQDRAFQPVTNLTETGKIVAEAIRALEADFPVLIKHIVIMPDHLHILMEVTAPNPRKLGGIISSLKGKCSSRYWNRYPDTECSRERKPFWLKGYNDKPLYAAGALNRFFNYIKDNPRRYLIRKNLPEYFYTRWEAEIAGKKYHLIGNIFLLQYPERSVIRFSRRYTAQQLEQLKGNWRQSASQNEVLVTTSIHPVERAMTGECITNGARIILLKTNGFTERSAVKGERAYTLCTQGRLLMIAPAEHYTREPALTRAFCMQLNALAEHIATTDITPNLLRLG